ELASELDHPDEFEGPRCLRVLGSCCRDPERLTNNQVGLPVDDIGEELTVGGFNRELTPLDLAIDTHRHPGRPTGVNRKNTLVGEQVSRRCHSVPPRAWFHTCHSTMSS